MARLSKGMVAAEMARRKMQFHRDENWDEIRLWGLFNWDEISHLLASGELHTHMIKENRAVWVTPSESFWLEYIKPLVDSFSLDELLKLAGWI
jgi:hypothetical protein